MDKAKTIDKCLQACADWGLIPTEFRQCMTWEEQVLWLEKFLKETVIPTFNQNTEAYEELKETVENFFATLDVQEEINNKLDEMADDGQLADIISQYLNSTAIFGYDTVASMKNAENLVNGSYARTLGYHSKNDGGSALYKIRTITNDDVVNEMDIIEMVNDNTLIAELVDTNNMTFEQFGAYGDGTHDDSTAINYVLGSLKYTIKPMSKVYAVGSTINITPYKGVDFNGATLKALTADMVVLNYYQETVDHDWEDRQSGIANLAIDCDNKASKAMRVHIFQKDFNNIRIYNVHNIGIHIDGGYENHFDKVRILSNSSNPNAIGWKIEGADSTYDNITGIDLKIFWDDYGRFNSIGYAHAWILTPSLSIGSKMFNFNSANTKLTIDYAYVDTYHYGFYNALDQATDAANLTIGLLWFIVNPSCFDFTTTARPTVFSAYGSYAVSSFKIANLHVESVSESNNSVFFEDRNTAETSPAFTGIVEERYIGANTTGTYNFASTYGLTLDSTLFDSIPSNTVRQVGRIVTVEINAQLKSTVGKNVTLCTIPAWLRAYGQAINTCCFLSTNQWGAVDDPDANCYLYLGATGSLQIRIPNNIDVASYKWLKIRMVYLRQN